MTRRTEDAEDVVQETLMSVVEHLQDFREEATFYTWVMRIATNHALKLIRKRRGLPSVPLEEEEGYADIPRPDYIAEWREEEGLSEARRRLLDQALEELDEKYRAVFLLRDVEGLSTKATAEALGVSEGNVKVRLLRARLMLRERLTRELGDAATRVPSPGGHA
jgi:RNA polymerase sigma-70 factor (ECF subfamily)